jgi:peptide methionine sulfoxide reductase msrA/msrB
MKKSKDFKFLGYDFKALSLPESVLNIVELKGTEPPFSKKLDLFNSGTFLCKSCGSSVFLAKSQFESSCGWPSFDDCIENKVIECLDNDGHRSEIICKNCHAHFGHVFYGESLTDKNTRYCVNSLSVEYIKSNFLEDSSEVIFAGGCFWGVEFLFNKLQGILKTEVGYIGGDTEKPTYNDVCSGSTGHIEAVRVVFDPKRLDFESLCKYFFEIHDPYQDNGQGPDIGSQYLSYIFYENNLQKEISNKVIKELLNIDKSKSLSTKIKKIEVFWPAEEYHQDYYLKTGKTPYCHIYKKKF